MKINIFTCKRVCFAEFLDIFLSSGGTSISTAVCLCVCVSGAQCWRPICTFWNTAFDSGTGGPIIEDIVTSNARAWMSNAKLRFFTLAEQCHTHEILI